LGNADKVWLNRWLRLYREPKKSIRAQDFVQAHPYRERMLTHAVRRMARFDGFDALDLWAELEPKYPFSTDDRYDVERRIALSLARDDTTRAYRFLQGITPRDEDERLQAVLLRAALQRHDWSGLLHRIERLPQELARTERWRYWKARALEQTGKPDQAKPLYRKVAGERSYYGFLAADRADLPYALDHNDTPVDPALTARIQAMGTTMRAREFRALDRMIEARREWRQLQESLDPAGLRAAAKLAQSWGWRDQAIFTLAKSGYWDDLELRFPLQHGKTVHRHAEGNGLEPAWVYAVIRQESAFNREARSRAGARGLMQLMPATARLVATKLLDRRAPKRSKLYDPAVNIDLGTTYLRHILDKLGNNPVLATAAYNAGPHRVKQWLPESRLAADVWVELVPFKETRGYLRRVMYYTAIYESRLGSEPTRISRRMRPIESATTYAARVAGLDPTG
jgi:soluble lytic murein transglycosylase